MFSDFQRVRRGKAIRFISVLPGQREVFNQMDKQLAKDLGNFN